MSRPLGGPESALSVRVVDPQLGPVTLHGTLSKPTTGPAPSELLVIVHGLGGSSKSGYMRVAEKAGLAHGMASLRLNLRGADEQGCDFYHAGLWTDLRAVLEHPEVRSFARVYVLGVSLGGHVTLRAGCHSLPPNVRALCALCPPLDLAASAAAFDRPQLWIYRRHVLNGLKAMYRQFDAQRSARSNRTLQAKLPSYREVKTIAHFRQWDSQVVAPRHGFTSRDVYYATQSVGPRLARVSLPTLVVTTRWDPMVPFETTAPFLAATTGNTGVEGARPAADAMDAEHFDFAFSPLPLYRISEHVRHVELARGGHLAFPQPRATSSAPSSLFHSAVEWLSRQS